MKSKIELKTEFEKQFEELKNKLNENSELDPRARAVSITNLETAKMWAVKSIFEK
jgi:hypothetical protein